jgi:hypothetical protein
MPSDVRKTRLVLQILAGWGLLSTTAVAVFILGGETDPDKRAIIKMALGLIGIWCLAGGLTMRLARDRFVRWAQGLSLDWRWRFVLFCTLFALIEEAVTTSMTNLGPWLGAVTDAARITISTHYFKVISTSVAVFIPWFICWAWLLGRYDFKPLQVTLLFGLTGTLAETLSFGLQNLIQVGMWVFVYGLMVYLPAHGVSSGRHTRPPRAWHWLLAVFLPFVFIFLFVAVVIYRLGREIWRRIHPTPRPFP